LLDQAAQADALTALDELRDGLREQLISVIRGRKQLWRNDAGNPLRATLTDLAQGGELLELLQDLLRFRTEAKRDEAAVELLQARPALWQALQAVAAKLEGVVDGLAEEARARCQQLLGHEDEPVHTWAQWLRAVVRSSYEQYHHYDFLSFPVTYATDVGEELAPVDVIRISPQDAVALVNPKQQDSRRKLAGDQLMNFGGFFQEGWRRNDILWGRLDAAERLIHNLLPEGLEALAAALVDQAHQRILQQHFAPVDAARIAAFVTQAVGAGPSAERSAAALVAGLAGKLPAPQRDFKQLQDALEAAGRQALAPQQLLAHFKDPAGYQVDVQREPRVWAQALSRGARVAGRVLEEVGAERGGRSGQRAAAWLTRAGSALWGLVIVATPDSLWALLTRHLIKLFLAVGLLLVFGAVLLSEPQAQNIGWVVVGLSLAVGAARWWLADVLAGRVPVLRTLALWAGGALALVGAYSAGRWLLGLKQTLASWLA
jgi:hypothetical protein